MFFATYTTTDCEQCITHKQVTLLLSFILVNFSAALQVFLIFMPGVCFLHIFTQDVSVLLLSHLIEVGRLGMW